MIAVTRAQTTTITARGKKELDMAHDRWRTVTAAVDLVLEQA